MTAGSYGNSIFSFVRNCRTLFQGGSTTLEWMRAPVALRPCQYLVLSVSWFLVILVSVYITVFFWALLYFLSQDAPDSSYIFPAPVLESFSPRSTSSFYWRMCILLLSHNYIFKIFPYKYIYVKTSSFFLIAA